MGDKGGKKDKEKSQKQTNQKQSQKDKQKVDKQPIKKSWWTKKCADMEVNWIHLRSGDRIQNFLLDTELYILSPEFPSGYDMVERYWLGIDRKDGQELAQ